MRKTVFLLMWKKDSKKGKVVKTLLEELNVQITVFYTTVEFLEKLSATEELVDCIFYFGRAGSLAEKIYSMRLDPIPALVRFSEHNLVVSKGETLFNVKKMGLPEMEALFEGK